MEDTRGIGAPGRVGGLVVEAGGERSVVLRWSPPRGRVRHTRFFVVCLRLDAGRRERLVATRFLPGHRYAHVEAGLPSGAYRFEVGALGPTGSGPRQRAVVRVTAKGGVQVLDAALPGSAGAGSG